MCGILTRGTQDKIFPKPKSYYNPCKCARNYLFSPAGDWLWEVYGIFNWKAFKRPVILEFVCQKGLCLSDVDGI